MAMTKRFKVTFEVTTVVGSESEKNLRDTVLSIARSVTKGEKVSPFNLGLLEAALEGGPEAAAEFCIKSGLRSFVKEGHDDLSKFEQKLMRFSPATVRAIK